MELPNKKYQIIYADPPWAYNESGSGNRVVHSKYNTMQIREIEELPIKNILDDNCILWLWVTFPRLIEGLRTIQAWGFEYKTIAFNWIKTNGMGKLFMGMGKYTRANSEICLIGIKGKPIIKNHSVHSVIISKLKEHSQKPDEIYTRIEKLMGDIPRIELFARNRRQGWDVWGNEAPNFTQLSLPSTDGDIIIAKSNKIKDFTSDSSTDGRTFANAKGI